jgi:alpha-mannosidase
MTMFKHATSTKGRFGRFIRELRTKLYPLQSPLTEIAVHAARDRISFDEAMRGKYRMANIGVQYGPGWSTHWFRVTYTIPREWRGEEVFLHFDSSSEGCVWKDGVPLQGLTNFNYGPQDIRSYFRLIPSAVGGEEGVLYVEVAVNGLGGLDDGNGLFEMKELGTLRHAELVTRDLDAWGLLWDFTILKELTETLREDGPYFGPALSAAHEVINAVTIDEPSTFATGREVAAKFFATKGGARNHRVSAVGHAHIDTAWLWPLAETKRKCVRSFSTAVRMMDDYPEYKFVCSQAQQLAWVKELQPALWGKIKVKAAAGQFIPAGGTWVEPDCNIPSGESLVRQFLLGQRFFKREFGAYCKEFWNPDVFGYSGALPQIMRGADIEFFLTQKLSWNQFNKPANSTFLWEGIDGSRVLVHFPPTDTYNAVVSTEEVLKHYTNFKDADRASESILLFGHGDGGGGPTEEMLERLRRLKNVPGVPQVTIRSPQEFFADCKTNIVEPVMWSGELYFETHRGTYTSQANNKLWNRRSEELLHDAEFWWAVSGAEVPRDTFRDLWEKVCLNQFHDIIPGTSINEVYRDSDQDYAAVLKGAAGLRDEALAKVVPRQAGNQVLALNTLSSPRRELAEVDGQLTFVTAPAYGYSVASLQAETAAPVRMTSSGSGFVLENGWVTVTLDDRGRVTSFVDKRNDRELIADQAVGNQYVMFEDKPYTFDAWDVELYHLQKARKVGEPLSAKVVESNPLRCTIAFGLRISDKASLVQRVSLEAESCRLDFAVEVDWQESEQFLKVEFPLALRSEFATYEIQFGHLRRPTHFNTSWDLARFEVCAHRWADLSEPTYGVALLNDSKYGYACHGNVLRLSLLRAPKYPDKQADLGIHRFRYALYPHAGGPQEGGVIAEAAAFNQPLRILTTDMAPQAKSFFSVDRRGVVIDTVKRAEDSDCIIVRLFEAYGAHQSVLFQTALPVKSMARVNLLEEGYQPVPFDDSGARLKVKPFELITLKLSLG